MASKTRLEPRLELCVQLGTLTGQLNNLRVTASVDRVINYVGFVSAICKFVILKGQNMGENREC